MTSNRAHRALFAPLAGAAMTFALLAGAFAPSNADSKDDIVSQRDQVDDKIKQAEQDVKESAKKFEDAKNKLLESEQQLAAAQQNLELVRGRLAAAEAEDRRLQDKLARAEKQLRKAEKKVRKAEKSLSAAESEIEVFTVETLLQGDAGLRAFGALLQGQDVMTFSEQMALRESISESQIAKMQTMAASRVMLDIERDRVEELRDEVAVQKLASEANLKQITLLTAEAEQQAAAVQNLVTKREDAKRDANDALKEDQKYQASLETERNALTNRLQKIIDEELRKAKEKEKKKKGGGGQDEPTGDTGGVLSRPVAGQITSHFGMRLHPVTKVYKLHDGTDFGAACGTPIRAAASGTIIEQYYNAGYGNRVILNNGVMRGVSVITTYNHLSSYAVPTGSSVSRGQVIGYVGTTGYSTGCHLHFMVLENGIPVNPLSWL